MKKIRIFLATLISILLFYSNEVYATTEGTYVPNEGSGMEKIILIVIGIASVALVLFIGYKMDKKEESKKRREKFIEENEEDFDINDNSETFMEDNDDIYSAIYNTITPEDLEDEISNDIQEDEDIKINNYIENIVDEEVDEELDEEEPEENSATNSFLENIDDEEIEIEDTEEQEESFINRNENIEKMISVFENADSTMVFNSQELKEKSDEEKLNIVKGYDFEEDDDLSELENTIKAVTAHIKRYTRKKYVEEAPKEPSKRYTRKKKKEKPASNVKRYTRKKPTAEKVEETVENIEVVQEEPIEEVPEVVKPKRGRPRKADMPVKPKRGRPRKVVEVEKPKRGRPRKTDAKKTAKKTTTKKSTTKK